LKTLVIYDISDDDKRSDLRDHLRDYGLEHIQYSGFLGEVNPHDRFVLSKEVEKFLSCERDSIYIVPLCEKCVRLCHIISENKREMDKGEVDIVG
jgi:CRISPR-associated protein Cas2